jgi:hypothetical protein
VNAVVICVIPVGPAPPRSDQPLHHEHCTHSANDANRNDNVLERHHTVLVGARRFKASVLLT